MKMKIDTLADATTELERRLNNIKNDRGILTSEQAEEAVFALEKVHATLIEQNAILEDEDLALVATTLLFEYVGNLLANMNYTDGEIVGYTQAFFVLRAYKGHGLNIADLTIPDYQMDPNLFLKTDPATKPDKDIYAYARKNLKRLNLSGNNYSTAKG